MAEWKSLASNLDLTGQALLRAAFGALFTHWRGWGGIHFPAGRFDTIWAQTQMFQRPVSMDARGGGGPLFPPLFFFFVAPRGLWDLRSATRD